MPRRGQEARFTERRAKAYREISNSEASGATVSRGCIVALHLRRSSANGDCSVSEILDRIGYGRDEKAIRR